MLGSQSLFVQERARSCKNLIATHYNLKYLVSVLHGNNVRHAVRLRFPATWVYALPMYHALRTQREYRCPYLPPPANTYTLVDNTEEPIVILGER